MKLHTNTESQTLEFLSTTKKALQAENNRNFALAFNLYNQALGSARNERAIVKMKARQAWCLHNVGNHKEASGLFQSIVESHTEEPQAYVLYATYLLKTDRLKNAKTTLKKGVERFPEHLEIYLVLASILKDTERSNEAIEVLKKALSQDRLTRGNGIERKDIWAELGYLYYERGNYNSAIASLKKSLRMSEEDEYLHYDLLAKAYLKIGDPQNAMKYIEKRLKVFGDYEPEDLIIKARAHARMGEYQYATANLLQAYSIEDSLHLKNEDMVDFSFLVQSGFFNTLENFDFEEI
ncbi:MAG: CDC27 family protein [Spirochaetota bacterium]